MIYKIEFEDGRIEFINERIIMKIVPIEGKMGLYTLTHFNGSTSVIKYFLKW